MRKLIEQIKITVSTFNGKIYQSYSHLSVRDTIFYNVAYFEFIIRRLGIASVNGGKYKAFKCCLEFLSIFLNHNRLLDV